MNATEEERNGPLEVWRFHTDFQPSISFVVAENLKEAIDKLGAANGYPPDECNFTIHSMTCLSGLLSHDGKRTAEVIV